MPSTSSSDRRRQPFGVCRKQLPGELVPDTRPVRPAITGFSAREDDDLRSFGGAFAVADAAVAAFGAWPGLCGSCLKQQSDRTNRTIDNSRQAHLTGNLVAFSMLIARSAEMKMLCLFGAHRPSLSSIAKRDTYFVSICESCARPLEHRGDGKWIASDPIYEQKRHAV